jgi:aminoglycoside phosphotransferase (APT) family kinase protein
MAHPRLHADQVEIDAPLVRALVRSQFPELARLRPRRVRSGGTENAVFRLGDELSLRLPLRPSAVDSLRKEIRWLPEIARHCRLPVPEIVAVGEASQGYPFPSAVVRWLRGDDALTARFASLDETADALADFVAGLRAADPMSVPPPSTEGFVRGGPLTERESSVDAALPRCTGLLDVSAAASLWADGLAAPEWTGPPVWLHADLIPGNLLVVDGRLAGVLDFGAMASGDPAYDVTPAWNILDPPSRRRFRAALDVDEATWRRARGLVVSGAILAIPYYLRTNPAMVATARRGLEQVLADHG